MIRSEEMYTEHLMCSEDDCPNIRLLESFINQDF